MFLNSVYFDTHLILFCRYFFTYNNNLKTQKAKNLNELEKKNHKYFFQMHQGDFRTSEFDQFIYKKCQIVSPLLLDKISSTSISFILDQTNYKSL